jgi:hypothetical protein
MKPVTFEAWLARANGSSVETGMVTADPKGSGATVPVPLEEVYECAFILQSMIERSREDQPVSRLDLLPTDLPMLG